MKSTTKRSYSGNKIGLYFGSFNPIHIGHLAIANYMVEFTETDMLWFVVTPHNPHKKKVSLLDGYDRLEMVHRAVGGDERFQVCDIEFYLPKPSYTIDTLTYLTERNPSKIFKLLIGSDNLKSFHKWKNFESILEHYGLIVYPRHDFDKSKMMQHPGIIVAEKAPMMEISSSFIRNAISQGKDVRHFLPEKVWKYINEKGFYHKIPHKK
jgi:nicotinate-nucleotide adenylyltransferase